MAGTAGRHSRSRARFLVAAPRGGGGSSRIGRIGDQDRALPWDPMRGLFVKASVSTFR